MAGRSRLDPSEFVTAATALRRGRRAYVSRASRSWRSRCRFRRSTRKCTGWWRRVRRNADAISTGECSTWNQGSCDQWRRYQRALKQRNAALRAAQPEALVRAWDPELIDSGESHRSGFGASISASCGRTLLPSACGSWKRPSNWTSIDGWPGGISSRTRSAPAGSGTRSGARPMSGHIARMSEFASMASRPATEYPEGSRN